MGFWGSGLLLILMSAAAQGCGTAEKDSTDDKAALDALASMVTCPDSAVTLTATRGQGTTAMASQPAVLTIPSSIRTIGGQPGPATLTYQLAAERGELSCRYVPGVGNDLKLQGCDRELEAESWVEARSVQLNLSDKAGKAVLAMCRVSNAAIDPELLKRAGTAQQGVKTETIAAKPFAYTRIPDALTMTDVQRSLEVARKAPKVRELLGERSAFVGHLVPDEKGEKAADPHRLLLTFFSHSHHRAVEVAITGDRIERAGFVDIWPQEGPEEIAEAIALALEDPRIAGKVADLEAGGMIWQPTSEVSYLHDRVMDIRFIGPEDRIARYFAVVDLTTQSVQEAGAVK